MIRPIPKRLLPHTCFYKSYKGNNGEGDIWDESITLKNVKVEEKMQLKVTSNGREVVGNAKLFYDCINSNGLTSKPIENSIIIYNQHEYRVVDTAVLCADKMEPHHYEILLK